MTEHRENVVKILREEYGIFTKEELNNAIRNLGSVDISIFCKTISNKKRGYKNENQG